MRLVFPGEQVNAVTQLPGSSQRHKVHRKDVVARPERTWRLVLFGLKARVILIECRRRAFHGASNGVYYLLLESAPSATLCPFDGELPRFIAR